MGKAWKNLLIFLGSQVPLIGVAVKWWAGVVRHPVVAALFALFYELTLLAWTQVGKEVWAQLKPEVVKVTADWVKIIILNLCSNFRRRYNRQVLFEHRVFNVRGMKTKGNYLEVEQVFVELNIAPSNPDQANTNPLGFKNLSGSRPIWDFLRRLKKREALALAIIGPPGCGKTTLLQHLALTFAANRQRRYRLRPYIPVLLFLREQVNTITTDGLSLADLVQRHFADQKRYPGLDPPPKWFARQLKGGKCLVLLDGLDEVVETGHRQRIAAWVDLQIQNYPHCDFVLTARPQGYRDAQLTRAHVLEVMPFKEDQVTRFIHNWYLATKLTAYDKDDQGVRQDAKREAEDLLSLLKSRPQLEKLAVNPLLLTMIANVHNFRGTLPGRRVELYSEICDVLLGHWQQAKGVEDPLTYAQKREVLQPLAAEMMDRKIRQVTTGEALKVITPHLIQIGLAEDKISRFLKDMEARSGLLLETEVDLWAFAHLTFQEYLCAVHWDRTGRAADWESPDWQGFIADVWWHETLRLYAAQRDATGLMKACLDHDTEPALKLAADISDEALKLDKSLRDTIASRYQERAVIQLRKEGRVVSQNNFIEVFGLSESRRPLKYIENKFEDKGQVVVDQATGLMWQKSGSDSYMTYKEAQTYVEKLNREGLAGYNNWRLPTIPELMSLLEPEKQSNNLYMNPVFDAKQSWCWSADRLPEGETGSSGSAWDVYFDYGLVGWGSLDLVSYVRCVRS